MKLLSVCVCVCLLPAYCYWKFWRWCCTSMIDFMSPPPPPQYSSTQFNQRVNDDNLPLWIWLTNERGESEGEGEVSKLKHWHSQWPITSRPYPIPSSTTAITHPSQRHYIIPSFNDVLRRDRVGTEMLMKLLLVCCWWGAVVTFSPHVLLSPFFPIDKWRIKRFDLDLIVVAQP